MCLKLALIMLTVLFVANQQNCHALSFADHEHWEKLKKEAKKETQLKKANATNANQISSIALSTTGAGNAAGLSPLQLFQSPIQPGGSYGLSLNVMNLIRWIAPNSKLVKKFDRGMSMLELYVEVQVIDDEEIRALNSDPTPDRDYQTKLKALKARKWIEHRQAVLERHSPISLR